MKAAIPAGNLISQTQIVRLFASLAPMAPVILGTAPIAPVSSAAAAPGDVLSSISTPG